MISNQSSFCVPPACLPLSFHQSACSRHSNPLSSQSFVLQNISWPKSRMSAGRCVYSENVCMCKRGFLSVCEITLVCFFSGGCVKSEWIWIKIYCCYCWWLLCKQKPAAVSCHCVWLTLGYGAQCGTMPWIILRWCFSNPSLQEKALWHQRLWRYPCGINDGQKKDSYGFPLLLQAIATEGSPRDFPCCSLLCYTTRAGFIGVVPVWNEFQHMWFGLFGQHR